MTAGGRWGRRELAVSRPARRLGLVAAAIAVLMAACDRPAPDGEQPAGDGPEADSVVDPPVPQPAGPDPDSVASPGAETAAPIGYRPTGWDTVFVFFTDSTESQVPVARPGPDTVHGLRAAFEALLRGPSAGEEGRYFTWFSRETAGLLRDVTVRDGFAVVDFEDFRSVIPNAVGSAGALVLLDELTATAFQFPGIRRVEFRIEGSCDALMGWLQLGCYPILRSGWDPPGGFREAVRAAG
ncbi:MAG: GerMN domain-containing protein [Longimicrobiales bacterium]|nr:GerMN domain-containing protein [Longimicrobiales bacterium]